MPKKSDRKRPEQVIMAEYVWHQTKGKNFHPDDLDHGSMDIKKNEVKDVLDSMVRAKYLEYHKGEEKPYEWTQAAIMIKADGKSFVDQQPLGSIRGIGLAGVAAVIAGATAASGPKRISPAQDHEPLKGPAPKRKYVRKAKPPVAPDPSLADVPTAPPGPLALPPLGDYPASVLIVEAPPSLNGFGRPLLTAPEGAKSTKPNDDQQETTVVFEPSPVAEVAEAERIQEPLQGATNTHGFIAGPLREKLDVAPQVPVQVFPPLRPLFLSKDEAFAFELLGEAPLPLRLSWLQKVGLGDGDEVSHFMRKLIDLEIIAEIPNEFGERDTAFSLDTVKYACYLKDSVILDPEGTVEKLRSQREVLVRTQAEQEAHREGMKETLKLATEAVTLRKMEFEEAQKQLQRAAEDRDRISGDLEILEGEIEAANFPGHIQSLRDREEVAEQASLLNSLELHELMALFLAKEEGKEG